MCWEDCNPYSWDSSISVPYLPSSLRGHFCLSLSTFFFISPSFSYPCLVFFLLTHSLTHSLPPQIRACVVKHMPGEPALHFLCWKQEWQKWLGLEGARTSDITETPSLLILSLGGTLLVSTSLFHCQASSDLLPFIFLLDRLPSLHFHFHQPNLGPDLLKQRTQWLVWPQDSPAFERRLTWLLCHLPNMTVPMKQFHFLLFKISTQTLPCIVKVHDHSLSASPLPTSPCLVTSP